MSHGEEKVRFRCTRSTPYGPGCPGYTDTTARQGHYIKANSEEEAITEMQKRFPNESPNSFTAVRWED